MLARAEPYSHIDRQCAVCIYSRVTLTVTRVSLGQSTAARRVSVAHGSRVTRRAARAAEKRPTARCTSARDGFGYSRVRCSTSHSSLYRFMLQHNNININNNNMSTTTCTWTSGHVPHRLRLSLRLRKSAGARRSSHHTRTRGRTTVLPCNNSQYTLAETTRLLA